MNELLSSLDNSDVDDLSDVDEDDNIIDPPINCRLMTLKRLQCLMMNLMVMNQTM